MNLIVWEIWTYVQIPIYVFLFKRFAKRNIVGDLIAGSIMGVYIEFATEPLWDYHFKLTVYKDIPLSIIFGWGVMFTLVTFFSEKMYCWILKKKAIIPYDKRIFIFDVVGAILIGFPLEAIGLKSGIWDYRYDLLQWDWGTVPLIQMPLEALVGYGLLMLLAPTFVRYWQGSFEGDRA
ncbi:MAG: hypothetical protein ACKVQC_10685 [Elusimicrobiota bacterium]